MQLVIVLLFGGYAEVELDAFGGAGDEINQPAVRLVEAGEHVAHGQTVVCRLAGA